ncbi:MAG: iron ABC transporter permease [Cyanothece sp. SIO1E1]|nr:iron ABC transporter permease [Cyanothece sp. SIO1E1]
MIWPPSPPILGGIRVQSPPELAYLGGHIDVFALMNSSLDSATPLKLTIAGAALNALLSSFTTGILIFNQRTLEEVRFWLAGSLAGRDFSVLLQVLPYIGIGIGIALALGKQLTTLTLGEDVAQGLGQSTIWVKLAAAGVVVLLAGSSVALAGPIGFVGLVVPHLVRFGVGVDYRWILPYSAIGGAMLLSIADMGARLLIQPQELPVGVMTAIIGAPFFIYLAQWKVK